MHGPARRCQAALGQVCLRFPFRQGQGKGGRFVPTAEASPDGVPHVVHPPHLCMFTTKKCGDLRCEALEARQQVRKMHHTLDRTQNLRQLAVEAHLCVVLSPDAAEAIVSNGLGENLTALQEAMDVATGMRDMRQEVDDRILVLVLCRGQQLADVCLLALHGAGVELLLCSLLELAGILHLLVGAEVEARDLALQHPCLSLRPALLPPQKPGLDCQRSVLLHQLEASLLQARNILVAVALLHCAHDAHEILAHSLDLL
mmetsp:Transcript_16583/g.37484  ORF Transcript_16583/g.37484 Transcript_16583/m.37484 type:complete len:258 (-) Transcript_16583:768-1541(-)